MKDFKRSVEVSFVDEYGSVKSEYVASGGHINGSPMGLFSLPKEENGASWAAYFYPYLKISDLAAVKTVPPAAYVSNLFISKYSSSKPWSIVAGPKRGVISGNQVIGLEGSLLHNDREYLEPMGINPIVWENGVGVEIFANKTAKQTPLSALSSIHAREACIYIQDRVEEILKKYNWEANTARNREEIKTLVDTFLSNMKQGEGLYDFKTVMDTTNNTNEVIDRNIGVIDIYVEVVRGLEILAQRLTVLKTGSIESGNFE
jgi:phage tail sheath protein FI